MHQGLQNRRRRWVSVVAILTAGLVSILATFSVFTYLHLTGSALNTAESNLSIHQEATLAPTKTATTGQDLRRRGEVEKRQFGLPSLPGTGTTSSSSSSSSSSAGIGSIFTDIGNALSGLGTTLIADLNDPALALGVGIGGGAASGLNLTTSTKAQTETTRLLSSFNVAGGIGGIAANLGTGISSSVVSLIDVSSLTGNASSLNASSLQPYALALGTGIGNGTASGLKLSAQAVKNMPGNATGLPDLVGSLTFSLTKSLISNVDLSSLNFSGGGDIIKQIGPYLSPAGLGLGQGLGMGAQIALDLQPETILTAIRAQAENASTADVSTVVGNFAMGLVTSLFANVSVTDLVTQASSGLSSSSFSVKDLNLAPIAAGFARGFVQGAGDAVQAYGGIQALMNGTAPATVAIPNNTLAFDDSVGGGATGFGQGIGGQGVIVIRQLVGGVNASAAAAPSVASAASTAKSTKSSGLGRLMFRQAGSTTSTSSSSAFNASQFLDDASISVLTQMGLDAITCKGVGGIASVALGLINSNTISLSTLSSVNTSSILKNALPDGTIVLTNEGNTYEISTTALNTGDTSAIITGIKVNGQQVIQFGVLLALHIVFGFLLILGLLPMALMFQSVQNLLQLIMGGPNKSRIPGWAAKLIPISWLLAGPTTLLIFIFGAVVTGSAPHFQSAHGILGLFLTLISLPASALVFLMKPKGPSVGPQSGNFSPTRPVFGPLKLDDVSFLLHYASVFLGILVVLTGFAALASVALCATNVLDGSLWIGFGFGIAVQWVIPFALASLEVLRRLGWLKLNRAADSDSTPSERGWKIRQVKEEATDKSPHQV